MSKSALISIVVPIFNAEKYIARCVQSLLNQTYQNIEVILVNDGSTDKSGTICNELENIDSRIKVIHKINGGVASARNSGIKAAVGKYISFVDVDDFLELDTFENVCKVIENENPDCIDFGWKYINNYEEITCNQHRLQKNVVLDKETIKENILPPLLNLKKQEDTFIYDFVWNKVYKIDIICKNNIFFDEKRCTWEDRVFLVQYLKYCKTFYSMDSCFYNYVSVPNSLSRRYDLQYFDIILQNYKSYVEWFDDEYDFNTQYVYNYWSHSIENMILRSLKEKENKDQIRKNIEGTLSDNQVIAWYKNREPENELEKKTSNLISEGKITEVIKVYENMVAKQIKQEKLNAIKAKIYSVRKVFK